MKTRGIIFSGGMVRAILERNKRQTRRALGFEAGERTACPYGVAGDHLWVRETFAPIDSEAGKVEVAYRASCPDDTFSRAAPDGSLVSVKVPRWKSPLFLPKAWSRVLLEVTGSRLERLQDVSEADAVAEGCSASDGQDPRAAFREVWDALNGKRRPWSENPWVWVIEFARVASRP